MLKKLLKYDLKWSYKPLVIFYILAFIFACLGRIFSEIENSMIFNIIGQICKGALIAMLVNILINNLMRVWARFIKNIYKDESYLTHTLPVSKKTIYLSKILSAIITMFTSAIVILVCIVISFYSKENIEALKMTLEMVAEVYDSTVIGFLMTTFIVIFLEIVFALFSGYLGIIIGHRSNNMKIIKSIVCGMVVYMIPSIITLSGIYVIGFLNPEIMNLFNTVTTLNIEVVKNVLYGGMLMYIVYLFIYYFIGKRLFEKGINVD